MQAMEDGWSLKKEFGRKTIHLAMLLIVALYIFCVKFFSQKTGLFVLFIILVIMLELEYARLELRIKLPLFSRLWEYYREKEKKQLGANVFFMLGVFVSFAVFDLRIALAAILMTIFGDLAAALVGRYFGRIVLLKRRALEGIVAEFIVDAFVGLLVLSLAAWPVAMAMAVVATTIETLSTRISDNLTIPLFSGLAGQVLLWLTGLL